MDKKDLVLLIVMPLMLMGIVIYTERYETISKLINQKITGFGVSQEKQSNILGTYFVNTSFKAKISYGLDDYGKVRESLGIISECTESGRHITQCTDELNKENKNFKWELNCDKGAEKVLYDFAEFLQDCIDSDDNNCLCTKKFERLTEEKANYEIEINEDIAAKKLNLVFLSPKNELAYDVSTNGISGVIPRRYFFSYSGDTPIINLIFTDLSGIQSGLGPLSELIIYKNDDNKNKAKSIDFVRQEGDSIVYPEPEAESEYSTAIPTIKTVKKFNLHPCQLKPKNIYRFCVTQNNYKVMAYDRLDGKIKERNPVIKFASYVPDLPPTPLKNLESFDRPKAEKSVLLKWDKSNEKDIAKFRIYYADSGLKVFDAKISTEELRKNPNVFSKEIDVNAAEINTPIKLDECEFDYKNKKCMFSAAEIESGKLYHSTTLNSFIYSISIPDGNKAYDFAVTAVDNNNNEINNIDTNQKLPTVKNVQPIDDLPLSSENIVALKLQQNYDAPSKKTTFNFGEKPKNNLDGTSANDFKDYKVYYLKYAPLSQQEKASEINKILDSKLKNFKYIANVNYEQQGQPFFIDLSVTNPESGNVYFFVIVAADINSNPKEDQFKVKEIGANVLQLEVP